MDWLSTDCELMRLRISARLDGELSGPHRAELARHLEHCDACVRFAHALAGLTEVLRSDRHLTTPNRDVHAHAGTTVRSLLLLGTLTVILGAGKTVGTNHHERCHSLWGVATVCEARA